MPREPLRPPRGAGATGAAPVGWHHEVRAGSTCADSRTIVCDGNTLSTRSAHVR